MAWFSLAKIALQAGSQIYANSQRQRWLCLMHNFCMQSEMARGEEAYQGKLLEAREKTIRTNSFW